MNILFTHNNQETMFGIATALMALPDTKVKMWLSLQKPIFDAMEEVRPEYFFLHHREATKEIIAAINTYKPKVILFGVNVPAEIAEQTLALIVPPGVSETVLKNLDDKIPHYQIKLAGNLSQYRKGHIEEKLSSDIFYLSNSESNAVINDMLTDVIPNMNMDFKICGTNRIPTPHYLGTVNLADAVQLIRSTKVLIDFHESMIYNGGLLKTFVLSSVPNPYYPNFNNKEELVDLTRQFITEDKLRKARIKQAYKELINKDTYFHRLKDIGELAGVEKWTIDSMESLKRLRE